MMYPSESLARAAREQYHSLRHSSQAWVPFFPPFTQAELPPPPGFASKNPLHSDWEELPNERAERKSMLRFATAIVIGCTMLAVALTGLLAYPFVQEQTGFSLLSAQDTTECWCDKGPLPSGQAFARGSDVTMEVSGQPGIAIQGGVGILLQTTEARSISCMALRASPGVQAWDWRVEGRPTQANATRSPSGRHICVHFNQTLPWPASYVTMMFRYSQPGSVNDSLTAGLKEEPQALQLPINISCSNPAHHREPFAVFPFLERADLNTNFGSPAASATFSTLWNINVTAPASFAVSGAAGDMPLMDLAQPDGGPKSSSKTTLGHVFRATAPSVPSITLTGRS